MSEYFLKDFKRTRAKKKKKCKGMIENGSKCACMWNQIERKEKYFRKYQV